MHAPWYGTAPPGVGRGGEREGGLVGHVARKEGWGAV